MIGPPMSRDIKRQRNFFPIVFHRTCNRFLLTLEVQEVAVATQRPQCNLNIIHQPYSTNILIDGVNKNLQNTI